MSAPFCRHLQPELKDALQTGVLQPILRAVRNDMDLLMELRGSEVSVYFKGQSVAKITQRRRGGFGLSISGSFTGGMALPKRLNTLDDVNAYCENLPKLKQAVLAYRGKKGANEIEVEQLLVRFNNREPGVNTDYLILDRQIQIPGQNDRFDLLGLHWPVGNRHRGQVVELALIEVKFGLNLNMDDLATQLCRYQTTLDAYRDDVKAEARLILKDKLDLGLLQVPDGRGEALLSLELGDICFVVVLVDASPYSGQLNLQPLRDLTASMNLRLLHVGFGLWDVRSALAQSE